MIFYLSLPAYSSEDLEFKMIAIINDTRGEHNLQPLKYNKVLRDIAYSHSSDMHEHEFVSHDSSDGRNASDRILASNELLTLSLGENVARDKNIYTAHEALMESPGHRANILSDKWTHIGIGIVKGEDKYYITQNFIQLPIITDNTLIKEKIISNIISRSDIKFYNKLESIASDHLNIMIESGNPPSLSREAGFTKIVRITANVPNIEKAIESIINESIQYEYFGFAIEYVKLEGDMASLYAVFLFAND